MEPVRLGVNVDHIATIREARRSREPEPVAAAVLAELAGAGQIPVHLRGDRRPTPVPDVDPPPRALATRPNLEAAATPPMVTIAASHKPATVTPATAACE